MAIKVEKYINKIKPNLKADKHYITFYYCFIIEGKKYRGLIDLSSKVGWSKRDRVSFAESELMRVKNSKKDCFGDDNISLDKYMKNYFELLSKQRYKKESVAFYNRHISPYIGKKKLVDIRQLHIKDVIKKIELKGLKPRTAGKVVEILRPAFKDAYINRLISHNPMEGIRIKRPVTKKIVVNATIKLKQIYEVIMYEFKDNHYYKAIFLFAMQGRRKNEILSLKWQDVDFVNNFYVLRKTKNNEEQKIFLPNSIKKELLFFRNEANEYVFTSPVTGQKIQDIRRQVAKIKKRLNEPNFGLHYLRNVIVSAMGEQGIESIYLSGALGHNNPNTIMQYLTLNYLKSSEIASRTIENITNKND
ncbi:MAG: hypothetical protein CR967_04640 [Proteobacteria bacterium]|nr:MAG: hypothetical protein CR967_04640 [Pseudomonadota bacterium]